MWRFKTVVMALHNIKNRFIAKHMICFPAWSLAFEPEEVAVDEAVSMDASDVGWGETPAATTDTGWATFDSFTDIRMAPSRFVCCNRLLDWHLDLE